MINKHAKHQPKPRKRYPWGVEAPNSRRKRLEKILDRPEKKWGVGLSHDEARNQLSDVNVYLSARSKKSRGAIMRSDVGSQARTTTAIYILRDPSTSEVRYVGKTEQPLNKRLGQHISASKKGSPYSARWIRSLVVEGLIPVIEAVEVVDVGGDWVEAEQRWIRHYWENGARLTNLGDGGEGNPGFTHRQETRERLSATTKAYMNQLDVQRKHALSMSGFTQEDIETILNRIANGETQERVAMHYGVTQNYISRIVTGATFGWMSEFDELRRKAQAATFAYSHKLDARQANQIVEDYIAAGGRRSYETIARDYGVGYSTVYEIISGKIWCDAVPTSRRQLAQHMARNCARQKPSHRRKLTFKQAEDIRQRHENRLSIRALSREYNVDRQTIKKIVTGKAYREPNQCQG